MPDEIKAIYKQVCLSPYNLQFVSPWEVTVQIDALHVTCSVRFEQVDFEGKGKIGPGNMDARVRFELQLSRTIEVEGLRIIDRGEDETENSFSFDNELEVFNEVRRELAPLADLVSALIVGRIGHMFLQDIPHVSIHFVHDSAKWGYFSAQYGEYSASIGGELPISPIESDLVTLKANIEHFPASGGVMNARFFMASILNRKPVEQFILAFAGLESIIHRGVSENLGEELGEHFSELMQLVEAIDNPDVQTRLKSFLNQRKGALISPTLVAKFTQLSTEIFGKSDEEDIRDFKRINQLRNDIVHGRVTHIPNVPLFTSKGFAADNPVSITQRIYLKYLVALLYTR